MFTSDTVCSESGVLCSTKCRADSATGQANCAPRGDPVKFWIESTPQVLFVPTWIALVVVNFFPSSVNLQESWGGAASLIHSSMPPSAQLAMCTCVTFSKKQTSSYAYSYSYSTHTTVQLASRTRKVSPGSIERTAPAEPPGITT